VEGKPSSSLALLKRAIPLATQRKIFDDWRRNLYRSLLWKSFLK
jgi:hypothetical protein